MLSHLSIHACANVWESRYVKILVMENHGSDEPVGFLLFQVTTAMRPQVSTELKQLGIGMPEAMCLRHLAMAPAQSNADLARRMSVSPQAMNSVVRELQDLGALTRPSDIVSGRSIPIRLTRKGRRLLDRAEAVVRDASETALAPLSSSERAELIRLLRAVDLKSIHKSPPAADSV